MTSSSPISHITDETRAYTMFAAGDGYEDIARKLFGKATEENTAKARQLIQKGSAEALSAD